MRKVMNNVFIIVIMVATIVTTAICAENFTPDKIKDMLPNKTKQEVKNLLGSPTTVSQNESDESGQWIYSSNVGGRGCPVIVKGRIIFDEISEKAVSSVTIFFKNGVVQRIQLTY